MEQKISIVIWRILQHAIPIDMALRSKGMPLVSKCSCCVFSPSQVAKQMWLKIYKLMNISTGASTVSQVLLVWRKLEGVGNLYQWLCKILPGATLWIYGKLEMKIDSLARR